MNDPITKVTQELQRADGSEVRIVAQVMGLPGGSQSIDVYVLRRAHSTDNWKLCSDRPHPDWRSMSVEAYAQHGRSEMLQTVTLAEILKVTQLLGQPMACLSA